MTAATLHGETAKVPRPEIERWRWIALGLAALVPRAVGAVVRQPWHDEYFTVWASRLPLADLVNALRLDSGPPLPYVLVKLLSLLGLPALAAARTIAVGASTAAVLLGAAAARRAFGARAGWWTGALLAVHPLALAWSCEGRAYALLLAAVALGWERIESVASGRGGTVGLALAVALGCWSHAFGLILAATLGLAAFTLPPARRRVALLAVASGVASHLPWLPVAMAQPPAATAWMAQAWRGVPIVEKALAPVRLLPLAAPFADRLDLPGVPVGIQIAAGVLCLALLFAAGKAPRPWLLFALPAVGLGCLAALGVPAFYGGRGEALFLLPFLGLLGSAAGRTATAGKAAGLLAVAGAVVVMLTVWEWGHRPPSGEARMAAAIGGALPRGGTVVVGGYWQLGLRYHLRAQTGRFRFVNYPAAAATHPGWYDTGATPPERGELERLLPGLGRRPPQTAVVVDPGLATAADLLALARTLGLQPAIAVPGGQLYLPPPDRLSPGPKLGGRDLAAPERPRR